MMTLARIKDELRDGPYTFPGCYPKYFLTADCTVLSFDAVQDNWREVVAAHLAEQDTGWLLRAVDVNWENTELYCEHTGEAIESAYGDDD